MPLDVLGARVRQHRQAMSMSIRDLAAKALVSKTSILALEQGKSCRPATLVKICSAMGLHVERLLVDDKPKNASSVAHRHADDRWFDLSGFTAGPVGGEDRPLGDEERMLWHRSGIASQMLMFKNVPASAGFLAGLIEVTATSETRSHPGHEFVYVLVGTAEIRVGETTHRLDPGESLYIPEGAPHSYGSATESPVRLLSIRAD